MPAPVTGSIRAPGLLSSFWDREHPRTNHIPRGRTGSADGHILLSAFRVSMKGFFCAQKTILPSNQPKDCAHHSLEDSLILPDLLTAANATPPSQSPLWSLLDPSAHTEEGTSWSLPLPSPLPPRQSPRHKDPLTSSRLSPGDSEAALWFLYCKELTVLP